MTSKKEKPVKSFQFVKGVFILCIKIVKEKLFVFLYFLVCTGKTSFKGKLSQGFCVIFGLSSLPTFKRLSAFPETAALIREESSPIRTSYYLKYQVFCQSTMNINI